MRCELAPTSDFPPPFGQRDERLLFCIDFHLTHEWTRDSSLVRGTFHCPVEETRVSSLLDGTASPARPAARICVDYILSYIVHILIGTFGVAALVMSTVVFVSLGFFV